MTSIARQRLMMASALLAMSTAVATVLADGPNPGTCTCTANQCVQADSTTPAIPCTSAEVCCCCKVSGAWTCVCRTQYDCLNPVGEECYDNPAT